MMDYKKSTRLLERLPERDFALLQGLDKSEAERFAAYIFSVPKKPDGVPRLRSQAIGVYDPFCDRRRYPLGILWQSAPYSFCDHKCVYCYGRSYLRQFAVGATVKKGFCRAFDRSLAAMKALNLPPRHLSMANSTDVLQKKLEREYRHTLYMLRRLREYRGMFSSFCILTKNPGLLLDDPRYVEAIKDLRLEVQISIAFWADDMGKRLEPGAPTVSARRAAVEALIQEGVTVALRLDPLFPRGVRGCTEYQSINDDLKPLISWGARAGISYVISSPLKLVFRRNTVKWFNESVMKAFPEARGGYRRMTDSLQQTLLKDLRNLCEQHGLGMEHCLSNILKRSSLPDPVFEFETFNPFKFSSIIGHQSHSA